jgi:hypothetical protein
LVHRTCGEVSEGIEMLIHNAEIFGKLFGAIRQNLVINFVRSLVKVTFRVIVDELVTKIVVEGGERGKSDFVERILVGIGADGEEKSNRGFETNSVEMKIGFLRMYRRIWYFKAKVWS